MKVFLVFRRIMESVPKPRIEDTCSNIKDIPNNESTPISSRQTDDNNDTVLQSIWIRNKSPISEEYLKNFSISKDDIKLSLKRVQPSSKREGFATVPNVTWDDIGSLKDIRENLNRNILVRERLFISIFCRILLEFCSFVYRLLLTFHAQPKH